MLQKNTVETSTLELLKTENTRLYSIKDIAAMKLNAIAGNGTRSKDFIDIYFILKKHTFKNVLNFYKTKYKDRNLLHIVKRLNYFDDINIQDWPEMILEQNLSLQKVKKEKLIFCTPHNKDSVFFAFKQTFLYKFATINK